MDVREVLPGEENRWDEYVRSSPNGVPQHLIAWKKVMEEVFNSETYYYLAEENGQITGVLPLIHVKGVLSGNYVTSQPGGICADNDEAAGLLFEYAKELVIAHKAKYLIFRDSRKKWDLPDLVTDEEHVTFLIEMYSSLEQMQKTMKRNTRQLINQVSNNSLVAVLGLEKLNEYYSVYARSMRDLGTPTLGLAFFKSMATYLPYQADMITIYHDDLPVGGGFIALFGDTIYCLWSGLLHKYYDLHTSYLLLWESIKYAYENGFRWVDLGRCRKNSGGYHFKKRFGGQVQQLYQQVYLNGNGHAPKVGATRAEDWTYRYFVKVWRRLPLRMTEAIGPVLRKQMPFG